MNATSALVLDNSRQGPAELEDAGERPRGQAGSFAAVAGALFAAGAASWTILLPRHDAAAPVSVEPAPPAKSCPFAAPGPVPAPEPDLEPSAPGRSAYPQYEDGLAPMRFLDLAASGPAVTALTATRARASRLEPRVYRGPHLSLAEGAGRLMPVASFLSFAARPRAAAAGRWLTEEARAAQARARAPASNTWAATWEAGARAYAQSLAAAQGRAIDHMDVVCVGHTDKCQMGEMKVTYADGTSQIVKYDPLVFDIAGTGFKASGKTTQFDLDGSGAPQLVSDLSAGEGLLVFDSDKDGVSGGGPFELFSAATDLAGALKPGGFADGFDAFNGLVKKAVRERVIRSEVLGEMRLGPGELAALERAYGLKIRVGGFRAPAVPLAQAGIVEIALSANPAVRWNAFDGRGTDLVRREGADFLRADGTRGQYGDIYLSPRRLAALTR